jgi:hypothetical protein
MLEKYEKMVILNKVKKRINRYCDIINFRIFESKISKRTWQNHDEVLQWAESMAILPESVLQEQILSSDQPIVKKGFELRQKVMGEFSGKYANEDMKILIHIPSKEFSPGGYSLFSSMADSFKFVGIKTDLLFVGDDVKEKLDLFEPTILLSSDHKYYTSEIDWNVIKKYKKSHSLQVGLTASLEEYGNTSLIQRLNWAKKHGIDFYYSFRAQEYFTARNEYKLFNHYGYKILSVEFGANPLLYYPIPSFAKDLDYLFLASSNSDKLKRYIDWLSPILISNTGFITGSGWRKANKWPSLKANIFLFSRAKVGINLHIEDQINFACELNERTYILAACGVPQIVDNAKLLPSRFRDGSFFVATNPKEYEDLYKFMLMNPKECEKRALRALEEVYEKHTTFHRASSFINQLKTI